MEWVVAGWRDIAAVAGPAGLAAIAATLLAQTLDAARPKPPKGEPEPEKSGFEKIGMWAGLVLPLMLIFHLFVAFLFAQEDRHVLGAPLLQGTSLFIALPALFILLYLVPWALGSLIGTVAPALGRLLVRAAPIVSIAAFIGVLAISWENLLLFGQMYLQSGGRRF